MPEPLSPEAYVAAGGSVCPVCGASWEHLSYGSHETENGRIVQPVSCNECNAEWWDVYTHTGYADLTIPFPAKETL